MKICTRVKNHEWNENEMEHFGIPPAEIQLVLTKILHRELFTCKRQSRGNGLLLYEPLVVTFRIFSSLVESSTALSMFLQLSGVALSSFQLCQGGHRDD